MVADIIRRRARDFPDNVAVKVDEGEEITFKGLDELSSKIANLLLREGIRKGDKVSCAMNQSDAVYYTAVYFGVQKVGGVFVPVNTRYSREEAEKQIKHSESKIIFISDDLQKFSGIVKTFTVSEIKDIDLPSSDPMVEISPTDPVEIIYTSGTTGVPKGVEVPASQYSAFQEDLWLPMFAGKTFLNPVPLFTFAGMTFLITPIRLGMRNIIMKKFDPHRFVEILEKEKVFSTYAVSSMWLLVLKEVKDLDKRDFSNLLFVNFGAAPMPPSAVLKLCEIFPHANIVNLYGLTEGGSTGCMMPPGEAKRKPASVGKPLPNTEIKIIDENGNELPPGQVGEIIMRAKGVLPRRYFKDERSTKDVWLEGGWVRTGDIGYLDEEGFLYLVDRKKDIVIRGGYNISTLEVEDAIYQHPAVKEVAVIGVPHEVLGEDIVAFIVPKEKISGDEIREFLLQKLADYKVPRRYFFVEELPKNALGKVLKKDLREIAEKEIEKEKMEKEKK